MGNLFRCMDTKLVLCEDGLPLNKGTTPAVSRQRLLGTSSAYVPKKGNIELLSCCCHTTLHRIVYYTAYAAQEKRFTGSAGNSYSMGNDGEQRSKAGFIEVIAFDGVFN